VSWYSGFKVAQCDGFKILAGILREWSPKLLIESPPKEYLESLGYKLKEDVGSGCGPSSLWVREL
jgi:hypothetical protein